MIEPTSRAPDLEAGLAEIDRCLRQIQDELAGSAPAEAPAEAPADAPAEAPAEAQTEAQTEHAGTKRQGRAGPLAAVLQRSARSAPSVEPPERGASSDSEGEDDARRVQDARAQLDDLSRQLHALADLRDKLLASIRQLVDGYQAAAHVQPGTTPSAQAKEESETASGADVTLSVGPFANLGAVRAFERAVASLPGVRETSVRGYEGADRAIVDVRLGGV